MGASGTRRVSAAHQRPGTRPDAALAVVSATATSRSGDSHCQEQPVVAARLSPQERAGRGTDSGVLSGVGAVADAGTMDAQQRLGQLCAATGGCDRDDPAHGHRVAASPRGTEPGNTAADRIQARTISGRVPPSAGPAAAQPQSGGGKGSGEIQARRCGSPWENQFRLSEVRKMGQALDPSNCTA